MASSRPDEDPAIVALKEAIQDSRWQEEMKAEWPCVTSSLRLVRHSLAGNGRSIVAHATKGVVDTTDHAASFSWRIEPVSVDEDESALTVHFVISGSGMDEASARPNAETGYKVRIRKNTHSKGRIVDWKHTRIVPASEARGSLGTSVSSDAASDRTITPDQDQGKAQCEPSDVPSTFSS
ncbi:hypothetical protein Q5752_001761 [Cryptotrichosporon argae]